MDTEKRKSWLRAKIDGEERKADTIAFHEDMHWDSEELVELTRADIRAVLLRYLSGNMTPEDVEAWADFLEVRDDIGYEVGHEELVKQAIVDLANPILAEPLTPTFAKEWLAKLSV